MLLLTPGVILAGTVLPSINGEVQYNGNQKGKIVVCAFLDAPKSLMECVFLDGPGDFEIPELPFGKYDVCAFLDLGGDKSWPPEPDEPSACTTADLTKGPVDGVLIVLEDPEPEFVPEPGAMVLLGSGLAGLSGYATLRWRTRE